MLITFRDDGRVEFTRTPQLLSLFPNDAKRIQRMTDIRFDEDLQRYYVVFLLGPTGYAGRQLSIRLPDYGLFAHEYGGFDDEFQLHTSMGGLITFDTYEAAVRAEIKFVEFLRDLGHSMV